MRQPTFVSDVIPSWRNFLVRIKSILFSRMIIVWFVIIPILRKEEPIPLALNLTYALIAILKYRID